MQLENKVAIVTGAAQGIGEAYARGIARQGAVVVVADIDESGGGETVAQIEAAGGRAAFVRSDVTGAADAKAMIAFAEETFGGLDILHKNAGITTPRPRFPDADPESWMPVIEINLRGVILGTQFGIAAMKKRGGGAIVNTASLAGIGYGFPPDPVYAASKGGVVLFTASLAPLKDEMNIRVNCVCPGVVDTPMFQRGRDEAPEEQSAMAERMRLLPVLQPEDVADAVVEFIRDDTLAGRAMWLRNGMPRELGRMPQPPAAR